MNYHSAFVRLPVVRESSDRRISSPTDVRDACADIAALAQESFHVLTIDAKNRLINRHLVSLGVVDASLVHAREVFRAAVVDGACAVALAHNHPSGDPTPSAEDVRITRKIIEAGKVLDIRVMDHVVVGRPRGERPGHVSMRESGLCGFE